MRLETSTIKGIEIGRKITILFIYKIYLGNINL